MGVQGAPVARRLKDNTQLGGVVQCVPLTRKLFPLFFGGTLKT